MVGVRGQQVAGGNGQGAIRFCLFKESKGLMHMVSRPGRQPPPNLIMLMGGAVIHHQADIQFLRYVGLKVIKEGEKLLMAMARRTLRQYLAGSDIQGSKKCCGAGPHIIMGHSFQVAQPHGQHRLGAVQGLDLAFSAHTQDQSLVWRIKIEPHNVPHPPRRRKRWESLKCFCRWSKAKSPPDAVHCGLGKFGLGGQGTDRPVSAGTRLGLHSVTQESGYPLIADGAGASRPGCLIQTHEQTHEALMRESASATFPPHGSERPSCRAMAGYSGLRQPTG